MEMKKEKKSKAKSYKTPTAQMKAVDFPVAPGQEQEMKDVVSTQQEAEKADDKKMAATETTAPKTKVVTKPSVPKPSVPTGGSLAKGARASVTKMLNSLKIVEPPATGGPPTYVEAMTPKPSAPPMPSPAQLRADAAAGLGAGAGMKPATQAEMADAYKEAEAYLSELERLGMKIEVSPAEQKAIQDAYEFHKERDRRMRVMAREHANYNARKAMQRAEEQRRRHAREVFKDDMKEMFDKVVSSPRKMMDGIKALATKKRDDYEAMKRLDSELGVVSNLLRSREDIEREEERLDRSFEEIRQDDERFEDTDTDDEEEDAFYFQEGQILGGGRVSSEDDY